MPVTFIVTITSLVGESVLTEFVPGATVTSGADIPSAAGILTKTIPFPPSPPGVKVLEPPPPPPPRPSVPCLDESGKPPPPPPEPPGCGPPSGGWSPPPPPPAYVTDEPFIEFAEPFPPTALGLSPPAWLAPPPPPPAASFENGKGLSPPGLPSGGEKPPAFPAAPVLGPENGAPPPEPPG